MESNDLVAAILILIFITTIIAVTVTTIKYFINVFYPTKEKCFNNIWSEKDRKIMYNLVKDVTFCLESQRVRHFAVFGTLLGVMRHNDVIPHDDDVDIAYFESDKENLQKALKQMQQFDIDYTKPRENLIGGEYLRVFYKNTTKLPYNLGEFPYIDIFESRSVSKDTNGDEKNTNRNEKNNDNNQNIFIYPSAKKSFDSKSLLPLTKRKFGPLMIFTPKDPFIHLDSEFGKDRYSEKGYMKLIVGSNFNHFLQIPCFCHFLSQPLQKK